MKKLASILAVTLAAGVLATGCGSSSGSASKDSSSDSGKTVIKAATGANAKPYVYVGDDDKPAGYDVDVLNAVFNKLPDYELEYEVTDFGSVLSGLNSGNYQIGVNNFSYNEDRGASYLYSYPYDKISYVFVTKKGGKEIKSFEDAAGLSFEGGTGISVSNAVEAWNEKNPDKAINITYSDADTSVFLQHVADGSQDFTIIDLAMYNSYMEEFNYDVQKNDIPEDEAKMIAENSYAYYIFPQDQKDLREQVDKALKELKEDGRGFGSILTFEVDSKERAYHILENVKLIQFAESLGGTETLITYPITQTHADLSKEELDRNGITDRILRLSVGIEGAEDLIADLEAVLK